MSAPTRLLGSLSLAALAACSFGMSQVQIAHDLEPAGASVRIVLGRGVLAGELISVAEDTLLLLVGEGADSGRRSGRLFEIAKQAVDRVETLNPPVHDLRGPRRSEPSRPPTPALWERLRVVSRHPQGVSPELVESLLRSLGQESVDRATP